LYARANEVGRKLRSVYAEPAATRDSADSSAPGGERAQELCAHGMLYAQVFGQTSITCGASNRYVYTLSQRLQRGMKTSNCQMFFYTAGRSLC